MVRVLVKKHNVEGNYQIGAKLAGFQTFTVRMRTMVAHSQEELRLSEGYTWGIRKQCSTQLPLVVVPVCTQVEKVAREHKMERKNRVWPYNCRQIHNRYCTWIYNLILTKSIPKFLLQYFLTIFFNVGTQYITQYSHRVSKCDSNFVSPLISQDWHQQSSTSQNYVTNTLSVYKLQMGCSVTS